MNGAYVQGYGSMIAAPGPQFAYAQPGSTQNPTQAPANAPPLTPAGMAAPPSGQTDPANAPLTAKQENGLHLTSDRISTPPHLAPPRPSNRPLAVSGVYAFQDEAAGFNAELIVVPSPQQPLNASLHFVLTANHGAHVIKKYDPKDLKDAHFFIVSDDGSSFTTVHPKLQDGQFVVDTSFAKPGAYHLYAEVTPEGEAHEAFHFDFPVDAVNQQAEAQAADQKNQSLFQLSAPYTVHLSARTIAPGQSPLRVTIDKTSKAAGIPPADLEIQGYFINKADLSFSRVIPTLVPATPGANPKEATFEVPTELKPGNYRLWLRFSDGNQVHSVCYQVSTTTPQ